ncbi:hypothetical protein [uncultured Acinetobacter sp.]|uniref:hypothetical protein n=1 Tax=uncultured Acinetobacter sp. TaxID=165433 RepID=UPI00258E6C96|nr:hypothetical protein [uncultured Acinetobacter sp.]
MDTELEQLLIEDAINQVSNLIDLGFTIIGKVSQIYFDSKEGIATVHISLKRDINNYSEQALEKYLRFKLNDNGTNYCWLYMDSDG